MHKLTYIRKPGSLRPVDSEESAFDLKSAFASVHHTSHRPQGSPSDVSMCSWSIRRQSPSFRPIALPAANNDRFQCIVTRCYGLQQDSTCSLLLLLLLLPEWGSWRGRRGRWLRTRSPSSNSIATHHKHFDYTHHVQPTNCGVLLAR